MKKINNKGFSLSELLIVMALLAVMLSVLVPSALSAVASSHKKVDAASIEMLETTLCNAVQRTDIYRDAQKIIDNTLDQRISFVYVVVDEMVVFSHCEIIDTVYGSTTNDSGNDSGEALSLFAKKVVSYVDGHIDPIELKSQYYKQQDYRITITLSDFDVIVYSTTEMGQFA